MKVVINRCYGGFGLSMAAENAYASRKGLTLYRYTQTEYKHRDGRNGYVRYDPNDKHHHHYHCFTKDMGDAYSEWSDGDDEYYWASNDIERTDPDLVFVVDLLGDAANGQFAELQVVDVPDDVNWGIEEYDGREWVAEEHRTW